MDWIIGHQAELLALLAAAATLGGVIVKLTPTQTDDKWWATIMRLFGRKS